MSYEMSYLYKPVTSKLQYSVFVNDGSKLHNVFRNLNCLVSSGVINRFSLYVRGAERNSAHLLAGQASGATRAELGLQLLQRHHVQVGEAGEVDLLGQRRAAHADGTHAGAHGAQALADARLLHPGRPRPRALLLLEDNGQRRLGLQLGRRPAPAGQLAQQRQLTPAPQHTQNRPSTLDWSFSVPSNSACNFYATRVCS